MKRVLIIGCGDVALRAIPLFRNGYKLFALVRDRAKFPGLRALGVIPILGNLDDRRSLQRVSGLADTVLHFAPPPNIGITDTRTHNLLSALSYPSPDSCYRHKTKFAHRRRQLPKQLVYISTSGVYGDCGGAWVNETQTLNPAIPRSRRRVDAESQIRTWARHNRVHASILRVPGIYAPDRLPLSRIQQGTPCIIASEDGYTNHIHADDLARISLAALRHGKACRVYHASDDSQLKMGEYFDLVADTYRLPRVPRISRTEAQHMLPEALLSFMNESRRLTNQRLKRELKVKLHYPMVQNMLVALKQT